MNMEIHNVPAENSSEVKKTVFQAIMAQEVEKALTANRITREQAEGIFITEKSIEVDLSGDPTETAIRFVEAGVQAYEAEKSDK